MSYRGPERRRRRVYTTRNTEYHTFDDVCVAVRDRSSGRWHRRHLALARILAGGVKRYSNGALLPSLEMPAVGDGMYFVRESDAEEDSQVITSRVHAISRPGKALVRDRYPRRSPRS